MSPFNQESKLDPNPLTGTWTDLTRGAARTPDENVAIMEGACGAVMRIERASDNLSIPRFPMSGCVRLDYLSPYRAGRGPVESLTWIARQKIGWFRTIPDLEEVLAMVRDTGSRVILGFERRMIIGMDDPESEAATPRPYLTIYDSYME